MIAQNTDTGEIADGDIRYVMIRADVLMGLAREWPNGNTQQFVEALQRSACQHSRHSFATYQAGNRFAGSDFLTAVTPVAAKLGWGAWSVSQLEDGRRQVVVRNSPFAAGFGHSSHPVCGAICGVLEAMVAVGYDHVVRVSEDLCAAQGHGNECIFNLTPAE